MQKVTFFLMFMTALTGCRKSDQYTPDSLNAREKDELIWQIVRYVAKAPEKVKDDERFAPKHDPFYQQQAGKILLERYTRKGGNEYFLISQPAPSLTEKRHATGGRLVRDKDGDVIEYEEIFRTWKMVPDTLRRRSYFLFGKMVEGEPLEPYYTMNSQGVEYIEFPDERTYFDIESRKWKVKP